MQSYRNIGAVMDELLQYLETLINYAKNNAGNLNPASQQALAGLISQIMEVTESQSQEPFGGNPQPPQPEPQGTGAPPSPDAQLLWILAGQQEDAFLQYLQQYSTLETQALLRNPAELERVVQFLHAMMPSGRQPVVDGIQHADLNSSTIWGHQYDPSTGKMKVRFQGGAEYEYDGIPPNIYRAFSDGSAAAQTDGQNDYGRWWRGKNPSLGAAMNQYIKQGGFSFRRLN